MRGLPCRLVGTSLEVKISPEQVLVLVPRHHTNDSSLESNFRRIQATTGKLDPEARAWAT